MIGCWLSHEGEGGFDMRSTSAALRRAPNCSANRFIPLGCPYLPYLTPVVKASTYRAVNRNMRTQVIVYYALPGRLAVCSQLCPSFSFLIYQIRARIHVNGSPWINSRSINTAQEAPTHVAASHLKLDHLRQPHPSHTETRT